MGGREAGELGVNWIAQIDLPPIHRHAATKSEGSRTLVNEAGDDATYTYDDRDNATTSPASPTSTATRRRTSSTASTR
jgi:hypothetical protein